MSLTPIQIDIPCRPELFHEEGYLSANSDVAAAIRSGLFKSGFEHFTIFGQYENRRQRDTSRIVAARSEKMKLIRPILRSDMNSIERNGKLDFLTDDLRSDAGICATDAISQNDYDEEALSIIRTSNLVLDAGAGRRKIYYQNVVNLEIVDYDTTDVLAIGEELPFVCNSFDAVLSIAVLEHVRDPFRCAREIIRVLKPGGRLACCVPFLQPLHGYPHHYYNMTGQGLRALFERDLTIDRQLVLDSIAPIRSLTWIARSWADGLSGQAKDEFLNLSIKDLVSSPPDLVSRSWCKQLTEAKKFELASATLLIAHKAV